MTLSEFLKSEGNSASKLAETLGVAVSTITRVAKGKHIPSRALMEAIFQLSSGAVTPNDIFGIGPVSQEGVAKNFEVERSMN